MKNRLANLPKSLIPLAAISAALVAIAILLFAALLFATCDMPMGLGPPVDTTAPSVFIETPADNEFIKGVVQGRPVIVTGSWIDDFGVVSMRFEVFNKTLGEMIDTDSLTYAIDPNGKWRAEITLPSAGNDDYTIKAYAYDKFKNEGAATVNVRIDIVPPWIKSAQTLRHPLSGYNFSSEVYPVEHYEADGYQLAEAYRNIRYNQIDAYHNETFSIRVEIEPSYAEVAESRLFVKDENDVYLHTEGLAPSGYWTPGEAQKRFPQWNLTAAQLERWRATFSSRASYIFFEVHAWSEAAWDSDNDRPYPGEPGRVQRIDGTVWYPESDYPHIYIEPDQFVNNILVLQPNLATALTVEFYDDDRLGTIHAKLLTKQEFDTLVSLASPPGLNEDGYINSLTDLGDASGNRAMLLNQHNLQNLFTQQSAGDNRRQTVTLSTMGLGTGEFRLIALVKDDKSRNGYTFEDNKVERWSAYPPIKIQIHNADAPFIFIDSPERENVFPSLAAGGGESFTLGGYTLGRMETASVQIAWVPKALQANGLANAITVLDSGEAQELAVGQKLVAPNGITVWKLAPQQIEEKTMLNGVPYFRADFGRSFHIVNDFQYNGALENDEKLFVIQAANFSARTNQNFNLPGLVTGPEVEVTSHRRGAGHDPGEDLTLRMAVAPGNEGVKVKAGTEVITDITGLLEDDEGFAGATALVGSEWTRTIPSGYIVENYGEGSTRLFEFRAEDILGNVTRHTREIIMTDQPLLQLITCAEEAGTYGIGTVLRFEASFSMPVRVTYEVGKAPKLKLYLTDPGNSTGVATTIWADYDTNTPIGNTLFFTYTVQENHTTPLLRTARDAIELNEALITSYGYKNAVLEMQNQDGSLQSNKAITLDGLRPFITRASFTPLSGNHYSGVSYYTNGKKITLKLITNEPVKIQGEPQAVIRYGTSAVQLKAQYSSKSTANGVDTLTFTHTFNDATGGGSNIIPMTQLEWGEPFFDFTDGGITDMAGNDIVGGGYATSLTNANRRGEAVASYPSERGYVKTTIPTAPTYTFIDPNPLTNSSWSAEDYARANPDMNASHVRINRDFTLRIAGGLTPSGGLGGSVLYYSLHGGNNPQTVPGTTGTGDAVVPDADVANKYKITYERSNYSVTVWQEDLAGNRSASAAARQVTINSRFPELLSVEMALPDGVYPAGTLVTFRLNFSEKLRHYPAGAVITSTLLDQNRNPFGGFGLNVHLETDDEYASQLLINWTSAVDSNGKDAKLREVKFAGSTVPYFGLVDEYGNAPVDYFGTEPESATNNNRPYGNDHTVYPQLNRPDVEFRGTGPQIVSAIPVLPTETGENYNGGVLTGRTFTLTFDVPITKVHGKYIYVRPYANWAIPPILSVEEMDTLLNNPQVKAARRVGIANYYENDVSYAKWLTNVDDDGVEIPATGRYSAVANNSYIKTTHGLTEIGGLVRPDTTTKWVLKFEKDLYGAVTIYPPPGNSQDPAKLLRDIFNLVQWKQQRIHTGSSQVTTNGNVATITLSEDLLPGRMWEVIWEEGAFQDAAGNGSIARPPYETWTDPNTGQTKQGNRGLVIGGYRFWSAGTAAPVVRVNRTSYNDQAAGGAQQLPNIDTEIRIDCETPGAAIRYDVIRSSFLPAAATGTGTVGGQLYNGVFTSTATSDAAFFGNNLQIRTATSSTPHVLGTYNYAPYTGYMRNTIGNDDTSTARDANGFLNTLLVPNTGGVTLTNGAPPWTSLTALSTTVRNAVNNNTGAQEYKTVSAAGVASYGTYVFAYTSNIRSFYAGEAYTLTIKTPSSSYDQRLYSGRRDYVVAAARKYAVNDTETADGKRFASPLLATSTTAGTEGVYKTTVIYRNPTVSRREGGGTSLLQWYGHPEFKVEGWLLTTLGLNNLFIFGVDQKGPVKVVSGFPLNLFSDTEPFLKTFRIGEGSYITHAVGELCVPRLNETPGSDGIYHNDHYDYQIMNPPKMMFTIDGDIVLQDDIVNNYLWATWDIVTDWYQGASFSESTRIFHDEYITTARLNSQRGKIVNRVRQTAQEPSALSGKSDTLDIQKEGGVNINSDMVAATYGGVTYRYKQVLMDW